MAEPLTIHPQCRINSSATPMAKVRIDAEKLALELSRRGLVMEDLPVSANVRAKIRSGQGVRQDVARRIGQFLSGIEVVLVLDAILAADVAAEEAVG